MRVFVCQGCGSKVIAPKKNGRTYAGHIKHMYCYKCGVETPHIQIEP